VTKECQMKLTNEIEPCYDSATTWRWNLVKIYAYHATCYLHEVLVRPVWFVWMKDIISTIQSPLALYKEINVQ
jgi:hypothetical protein